MAINVWPRLSKALCDTQCEGHKQRAACEAQEPAQIHPTAGMLKDSAALGEFTVSTHKREGIGTECNGWT